MTKAAKGKEQAEKKKKKKRKPHVHRTLIGWREWAALPSLGIPRIKAKVDTGARTSALHALKIKAFETEDGLYVRFRVHPVQRFKDPEIKCIAKVLDERWITNSGGHRERRYVIETTLRLDGQEWPIELSLANRAELGFRMLIGRAGLKGRCVIDPARSFLTEKASPRKKKKILSGPRRKQRSDNTVRHTQQKREIKHENRSSRA